jgi:hypothetical protein
MALEVDFQDIELQSIGHQSTPGNLAQGIEDNQQSLFTAGEVHGGAEEPNMPAEHGERSP